MEDAATLDVALTGIDADYCTRDQRFGILREVMLSLGPYRKSFSLAWSAQLTYRVNFIVGRVREFIVYGALLLLYTALPQGSGNYTQSELLTYILVSSLLGSVAFTFSMHAIASEIADGDLSNYLLRPLNYFGHWVSQSLAAKLLNFGGGIIQLFLLSWLFSSQSLGFQTHITPIAQAVVLFIGSLALIQTFDFVGGLLSFWTNRGHGPRWLITIFVQFLSGSYVPLDTLPAPIYRVLQFTPFPSLLFAPLQTYLGKLDTVTWLKALVIQWIWIGIMLLLVRTLWKRGLKTYGAYGR